MDSFCPEKETCPYCGSQGNCRRHAYYLRNLIWFDGTSQVCFRLKILRVKCSGCNHTHAILPDVIIPYACYGIQFIMKVLAEHLSKGSTVESVCTKYGISQVLFFRWLRILKKDKCLFLGLLNDQATLLSDFLQNILAGNFCDFSVEFILLTARSFLQNHKNPAIYRQTVF